MSRPKLMAANPAPDQKWADRRHLQTSNGSDLLLSVPTRISSRCLSTEKILVHLCNLSDWVVLAARPTVEVDGATQLSGNFGTFATLVANACQISSRLVHKIGE